MHLVKKEQLGECRTFDDDSIPWISTPNGKARVTEGAWVKVRELNSDLRMTVVPGDTMNLISMGLLVNMGFDFVWAHGAEPYLLTPDLLRIPLAVAGNNPWVNTGDSRHRPVPATLEDLQLPRWDEACARLNRGPRASGAHGTPGGTKHHAGATCTDTGHSPPEDSESFQNFLIPTLHSCAECG